MNKKTNMRFLPYKQNHASLQGKRPRTENYETRALEDGGYVHFWKNFLTAERAGEIFTKLEETIDWKQSDFKIYGKPVKTPRLQCWMADNESVKADLYLKTPPKPWSEEIGTIKKAIETMVNFTFDYVLINKYRDGKDYIGFHADREHIAEGKNVIASISLGTPRRFVMRHKSKNLGTIEYALTTGSLLVMGGTTQKFWKHAVPKQLRVTSPRINLTFRKS